MKQQLLIACCVMMMATACTAEETPPQRDQEVPMQPLMAPHEMILQLTPEAAAAVHRAMPLMAPPLVTGIESLDALFAQYHVLRIEPVFEGEMDSDAINDRFPERAQRADPNAQASSNLSGFYRLTLGIDDDVMAAVQDFSKDPNAITAEPNYMAATLVPPV